MISEGYTLLNAHLEELTNSRIVKSISSEIEQVDRRISELITRMWEN